MPIFDYLCSKCNKTEEFLEKISETTPRYCDTCNDIMVRQFGTQRFVFKGPGFHSNDYPKGK